jgi:hypothetical protein
MKISHKPEGSSPPGDIVRAQHGGQEVLIIRGETLSSLNELWPYFAESIQRYVGDELEAFLECDRSEVLRNERESVRIGVQLKVRGPSN